MITGDCSKFIQDPSEISCAVGEHTVRGDVTGKRMGEEISVAGELGPRLDAGRDSAIDSVGLGEVTRGDPESFDSQADGVVFIPRGLAAGKNPEQLVEREKQRVQRLFRGHNSRASTAPGTSSVMTWTYSPTIADAAIESRVTAP